MLGLTIFLSAFLLFQLQPLIARQVLPWFGGSAAVWTTSMLFFQILLLAGYTYAHKLSRAAPRSQQRVHIALLLLSLVFLPVRPWSILKPAGDADPALSLLLVLTAGVGLPYLVLSATNPLLGSWFARMHPERDAFRLFALSNLGALLALLTYPTLVEPNLSLRMQSMVWSVLYVAFAFCMETVARRAARTEGVLLVDGPVGGGRSPILLWLGLSACPSVLLLAITHHLTQNVAAIPFLWVVPLALYLVSFILCFESKKWYQRGLFLPPLAVALGLMSLRLNDDASNEQLTQLVWIFNLGLFLACMVCHGELSRLRPAAGQLTQFYLVVSLGGALGGTVVALLAPALFATPLELPLALLACPVLVTAALLYQRAVPAFVYLFLAMGTVALGAVLFRGEQASREASMLLVRNFFGPLRVEEYEEAPATRRKLVHGTINHGSQFTAPERRRWATSYYAEESGVGQAILKQRKGEAPQKVGVIGLGTGTLAVYGRPQDEYVFYDINPLVERLARSHFSYLGDCQARLQVVLGDARLSLERQPPQEFDVLAVDAFSSDSIPIHLLTAEAFRVYLGHLKPDGILAVHISNRFLNLEPVVRSNAEALGLQSLYTHNKRDGERAVNGSTWALVGAQDQPTLNELRKKDGYPELDAPKAGFRPWTDDYSNLFQQLELEE